MDGLTLVCLECGQRNRLPFDKSQAGARCGTCGASLLPSRAVAVDLATLRKATRTDAFPLVVDFWAPWCGPCRTMAPEFDRAAATLAGQARLVKLDCQAEPGAGAAYGLRGIPTLVRFANGRETARRSGVMRSEEIADFVRGTGARSPA